MLRRARLEEALGRLGDVLADRALSFQVVIVGGAALLLEAAGTRPTQDVDVVAVATPQGPLRQPYELPQPLATAARDVGDALGLEPDWMNAGAVALLRDRLPEGYTDRLTTRSYGSLQVSSLARRDLIKLKLLAACDEGPGSTHLVDLVQMGTTGRELDEAEDWVRDQFGDGPLPEVDDIVGLLRERRP